MNTPSGGQLVRETMYKKYGPQYYREIGRKGGRTKTTQPKGFAAATPEQRSEWGKKGGLTRRKK